MLHVRGGRACRRTLRVLGEASGRSCLMCTRDLYGAMAIVFATEEAQTLFISCEVFARSFALLTVFGP